MMYHVDKEIGYLVDVINPEDTLVIILGDNGSVVGSNDKGWATELGVNGGAIVWGGSVKNTPRVSEALHSVSDFYPTILELTGTSLMNANVATVSDDGRYNGQAMTLNGRSLMADIRDEGSPGNQFVFGSHVQGLRWVRGDNGYKYKNCECSINTYKLTYCGDSSWDEQLVQMTGATEGGNLCNSGDCSNLTGADLTAYNELKAALTTENEYVNGSGTPLSTCTPDPY
jgi:arylsulfatase A-like enzyme